MAKFLHDNQGNESSLRLMMAWAFVIIFSVWAVVCLVKMEIVDLPTQIALAVAAILTAKVWQKNVENKSPDSSETVQPQDTQPPQ